MATRTRQGFHVPISGFKIGAREPTGVYVENGHIRVRLHYSPPDDQAGTSFAIPSEPAFLRDLAEALIEVARDVENKRQIRPSHS